MSWRKHPINHNRAVEKFGSFVWNLFWVVTFFYGLVWWVNLGKGVS